ncbi:MAG: glycosyltransferase family 39 protein [Actinomycetota bacterium]|nr:glycosyltransferase family 39 protein [Actinomycetota bacterium]
MGLVTVAGLVGRLLFLGHQPLWRDEAFTAVVVQRPWGQMLDAVRSDSAPPLGYLIDHLMVALWSGPAALRVVSALAGAGAIPLGAALGRRVAGDRGGVVSALLCALTPALVLSARDARMYALATTLVMSSTVLLWRAVQTPSRSRWVAYAAVTALALYTQYFAVFAVAAQVAAVSVLLRLGWRTTLSAGLAAGIALLSLAPWLFVARAQFTHIVDAFWVTRLGFLSVVGVFVPFFSGPPVDPWTPDRVTLLALQGFAAGAGVLIGCAWLVFFRHRLTAAGRRAALFLTGCGVGAVLLMMVLSAWKPVLDGRYASVVWGPLLAVVGAGFALVRVRALLIACLCAIGAASVGLSVADNHPDTPSAVALLEAQVGARDLVEATPSQFLLLDYYESAALLSRTRVIARSVPWYWGSAAFAPTTIAVRAPADVVSAGGAIYLVHRPSEPGDGLPPGYTARSARCWTDVCVTVYSR